MACVPSPTATQFTTILSTSTFTSTPESVQTISGSAVVFAVETCLSSLSGACVASTAISQTSQAAGALSTIRTPVVVTEIITEIVPTLTLFASCTQTQVTSTTVSSSTPITTSSASSATSQIDTSSSASSSVVSSSLSTSADASSPTTTPSPSSSSSSTPEQTSSILASLSAAALTSTLTITPSSSDASLASAAAQPSRTTQQDSTSHSSSNLAPVLGGVLGGFFGLIALVGLLWYIIRRKRAAWRDAEDEVIPYPPRGRPKSDQGSEPKPYQYGLVGHSNSNSFSATSSPPHTPAPTSLNHSRPSTFYRDSTGPLLPTSYLSDNGVSEHGERSRRPSRADQMEASGSGHQRPPSAQAGAAPENRLSRHSQLTFNFAANDAAGTPTADYFGPIAVEEALVPPLIHSAQANPFMPPRSRRASATSTVPSIYSSDYSMPPSPGPVLAMTAPARAPSATPTQMPAAAAVASASGSTPPPPRPHKSSKRWRISQPGGVIVHTDGGQVPQNGGAVPVVALNGPPPPAYAE